MPKARIRFETSGVRLRFEGAGAFFDRALAPLFGARPAPVAEPPAPVPAEEPGYRPPEDRFGTFRRQLAEGKDAAAPNARVAAYAFFLWNYEKRETFTEEEIRGCFAAHDVPAPDDEAAVYGELLTQRRIAPGAAPNSWRLTSKGRDFVRHHVL